MSGQSFSGKGALAAHQVLLHNTHRRSRAVSRLLQMVAMSYMRLQGRTL